MTRRLNRTETVALRELPLTIPEYPGSHPFSKGPHPELYLEDELRKKSDKKSDRTSWFEKILFAMWRELGDEVPYVFLVDGQIRSLDAGCVGYLVNRSRPELALRKDSSGYIVSVAPIGDLANRYTVIEDRLRKEIQKQNPNPSGDGLQVEEKRKGTHDGSTLDTANVSEDVLALLEDESIAETSRRQLIDARIGQGAFRQNVLSRWDNRCAITGCTLGPVLRASHIKPWRNSTHSERLDPDNGLPLTANIDALFDSGLISFSDLGEVLFSSRIAVEHRALMPDGGRITRPLSAKTQIYLAEHRTANGFG